MTKSELITLIAAKQQHLNQRDVEIAVNTIILTLTNSVASQERIEIRGFGGFTTLDRKTRIGRNPKTGEAVRVPNRRVVHFKPGLDLRNKVTASRLEYKISDL